MNPRQRKAEPGPEPSCGTCSQTWCDDPTDLRYILDRAEWRDHILRLPNIGAVKAHVRERCRWFYGDDEPRIEADQRAMLESWETERHLRENRKVMEARAREAAELPL